MCLEVQEVGSPSKYRAAKGGTLQTHILQIFGRVTSSSLLLLSSKKYIYKEWTAKYSPKKGATKYLDKTFHAASISALLPLLKQHYVELIS